MSTGGCFGGAVRHQVDGALTRVTCCHCSKCRRWHGHVGAYTAADRPAFRITEQRGLGWHAVSDTVRRGFRRECGSSLPFDQDGDAKLGVCAGTLDSPTALTSKAHLFVASKGDCYQMREDGLLRFDASP